MADRIALVTGGASGIGRACGVSLSSAGFGVALVDVDAARGTQVAGEVGASFHAADLTDAEACRRVVDDVAERHGGLDVLVNVAGFQHIAPIEEFPSDAWDRMLALMVSAPFHMTQRAWPWLRRSGHGRVIHMGSAHSLVASPFKVGYVTAKHALLGHMKVTALEGGPHGITCNTVCPAYVRTPLVEAQIADQARTRGIAASEVEEKVFLAETAIKRMLEPSDVAALVTWLASEAAWAITGSVQTMDLGWTAR